jgi:hypothetical protein
VWRFGPLVVLGGLATVVAFVGGTLIGLNPGVGIVLVVLTCVVAGAMLTWRTRGAHRRVGMGPAAVAFVAAALLVFVAIQAVPYGRAHDNPPVTGEPQWASQRTRDLMVRACFGCHSNEVDWPWYSSIAPISWAVSAHVDEGREKINYSEFATRGGEYDHTVEVILDGSMPPAYYTRFGLHSEADLSGAERAELIAGLRATPGLSDDDGGSEGNDDRGGNESEDDGEREDEREDD